MRGIPGGGVVRGMGGGGLVWGEIPVGSLFLGTM